MARAKMKGVVEVRNRSTTPFVPWGLPPGPFLRGRYLGSFARRVSRENGAEEPGEVAFVRR